MSRTIYLVEDEKVLNDVLVDYLQAEGYNVVSFFDGKSAIERIKDKPDLWILDIMLPGASGYEVIKKVKEHNKDTPVIFMSARNEELDRVVGFELGSDDYITKSFDPRELVFRVNKITERVYGSEKSENFLFVEGYKISPNQHTVFWDQAEISLTYTEFALLMCFVDNKNIILTREQILEKVWGIAYCGTNRVADDTIRRLRKKMENLFIDTIYGQGYRLVVKQ